jgi:C-terminal processing protease CtpA/Prc
MITIPRMSARAVHPRPKMEEKLRSMEEVMPTIILTPEHAIQSLDVFPQCSVLDDPSCSSCSSDLTATCVVSSMSSLPVLCGQDEEKELKYSRRAALVSATVIKATFSTSIGLVLEKVKGGGLSIVSISPKSLLSDTPLEVGDRLISFNNVDCTNKSAYRVSTMLQRTVGVLTIVAEHPEGDPNLVECMVTKTTPSAKTGLGIAQYIGQHIKVKRIDPDGVFATTLLGRQDRILSINGVHSDYILNATEAAMIISNSEKIVTVVAERKHENAVVVALAV